MASTHVQSDLRRALEQQALDAMISDVQHQFTDVRTALAKYGHHLHGCVGGLPCSCGWTRVIQKFCLPVGLAGAHRD